MENVRVEKLENRQAHFLKGPPAKLSHQAKPLFASQFFPAKPLDDIQDLLRHEAFEFTEGLLSRRSALPPHVAGHRTCEEPVPARFEKRRRPLLGPFLQLLFALDLGWLGKLTGWPVVGIARSCRRYQCVQAPEEPSSGSDIGFGDLRRRRLALLIQAQLAQALPYQEGNVHARSSHLALTYFGERFSSLSHTGYVDRR